MSDGNHTCHRLPNQLKFEKYCRSEDVQRFINSVLTHMYLFAVFDEFLKSKDAFCDSLF